MTDPNTTATVRIHVESRDRLKLLARQVGVSQIALIRALAFATREDFRRCENRRLQAGERPDSGENS